MTFEQLQYFIAIVENSTYSNASNLLHISQSSLSKQIKKLEKDLGLELFDRKYRSATLTEAGKIFYSDALKIVNQYITSLDNLKDFKQSHEYNLSIGTLPIQTQYNLTSLFKTFKKNNIEINISIDEVEEDDLLFGINNDTYDLIIARDNMLDPSKFDTYAIAEDELTVVLPANHKLNKFSSLTLSDLSLENFILMNPYTSIYKLCINYMNKANINPNIIKTARIESILGSIGLYDGISLLPKSNFNIFTHENITVLPLNPPIKLSVVAAKSKSKPTTPAINKFITFLQFYSSIHTTK